MTTITRDHLTLLANAGWRMSDCEYGAPEIDGKRPYGNSGVEADLAELLPHLNDEQRVACHRELVEVIPAIIRAYSDSLPPSFHVSPQEVLATPMQPNNAGAPTIRAYLVMLLAEVWTHQEGFNGKRPFGNSDWDAELLGALGKAGYIRCTFDEDDYLDEVDTAAGNALITAAIQVLGAPARE